MHTEGNRRILQYLRDHQAQMVEDLTRLIAYESPSTHKPSVDRLGAMLAQDLRDLGGEVTILPKAEAGDLVRARWGQGDGGILILSHMDTVWDVGTVAMRPTRIEGNRLYGAGSMDMKGGIVIAFWALRALRELGLFPDQPITYLLNSDEEIGSPYSGADIDVEALRHRMVFVTEPPQDGAYKTERKGVSQYIVRAYGRAAHAGADHASGVNAIEEIAHQILKLQALTRYDLGTTVNVGTVTGGTRGNVVPALAEVEIDVRATTRAQALAIREQIMNLQPVHPQARLEIESGASVPPMERTPAIVALFQQAQAIAAELGIELREGSTGGGSDGNRTAALGVPTLDGMGIVGEGGHAITEYGEIDSMPERAAIMAGMLRKTAAD